MNTPQNNSEINTTPNTTSPRPLGLWLKVIDHRLSGAMDELFTEYGIGRREWRRLNMIGRGIGGEQMLARLAARPEKTAALIERGWVAGEVSAWTLTDEGERIHTELLEKVTALRGRVSGAVSPEDFATTLATLEAIARELGWSEDERMPHRRGPGHERGRRHEHRHGGHEGRGRRNRDADATPAS